MLITLAWRNIWRNRRRTLITAASILFSVFFAGMVSSLQSGIWDRMTDNVMNYYYGFAQVQDSLYWENKDINNAFDLNQIRTKIPTNPHLRAVVPRLESFALASKGEDTYGVLVVGIDPLLENKMTGLQSRVIQGKYPDSTSTGLLIAEGVASRSGLHPGDSLVLISQGYHGVNAAGIFYIEGIVHFPSPELNKRMVYMAMPAAQNFYGAPGLATSLALDIDSKDNVIPIVNNTRMALGHGWVVKDWEQLMPDLVQARSIDTASARLILLILYVIITFGIFGTVLMMLEERRFEFGVLLSIGMHRLQLFLMVWLELLFIAILGVISGLVIAFPMAYWLNVHPIQLGKDMAKAYAEFGMSPEMPASLAPSLFLMQALIVFVVVLILSVYPFYRISRMVAVKEMHNA
jgi:ABC-type lipoprotein release transport system permease subunit